MTMQYRNIGIFLLACICLCLMMSCSETDATSSTPNAETVQGSSMTENATKSSEGSRGVTTQTTMQAKKSSTTTSKTSVVTTPSSVSTTKVEVNDMRIICWGDSITAGMGMESGNTYPSVLQTLVGSDYQVINAGSSGEKAHTIAARQGALKTVLSKDITFKAGATTAVLGDKEDNGLMTEDGRLLNLNTDGGSDAFNNGLPANTVYINGETYKLTLNNGVFRITRSNETKELTIAKGTAVEFSSARNQQGSYCEIFYIGANDGVGAMLSIIETYKAMIERQGCERYLIVLPHWDGSFDGLLKSTFGDNVVSFREEACERGWNLADTRTPEDLTMIQQGRVPACLRYLNRAEELHLNKYGYAFLAQVLYEKGAQLGYWD